MEESKAWRHPVDLIALLEGASDAIAPALEAGVRRRAAAGVQPDWRSLVPILLGDNPEAVVEGLLESLRDGADQADVAGAVNDYELPDS